MRFHRAERSGSGVESRAARCPTDHHTFAPSCWRLMCNSMMENVVLTVFLRARISVKGSSLSNDSAEQPPIFENSASPIKAASRKIKIVCTRFWNVKDFVVLLAKGFSAESVIAAARSGFGTSIRFLTSEVEADWQRAGHSALFLLA